MKLWNENHYYCTILKYIFLNVEKMLKKSIKEWFDLSCMWSKNMILIKFRLSVIKLEQNSQYVYYRWSTEVVAKRWPTEKKSNIPKCFIFSDKLIKTFFQFNWRTKLVFAGFIFSKINYLLPILENKSIKTNWIWRSHENFCKTFADLQSPGNKRQIWISNMCHSKFDHLQQSNLL